MKVNIGPYLTWWGPYQIADLLQYVGVSKDRCFKIGEWLSNTWVGDALQWIYDKRSRTVVVKLDRWDSWNADATLAHIIVPLLRQLQQTKHGSPFVDNEDVPENLHGEGIVDDRGNTDDNFHNRWDYVLGEMIWAFEQYTSDWEAQYFTEYDANESDLDRQLSKLKYDREGHDQHQRRITNGLRLFGKYYQALWD
jgi:hypothetical protein